jgi:hypothetical protein
MAMHHTTCNWNNRHWTALGRCVYRNEEVDPAYTFATNWAAREMARFCNAIEPQHFGQYGFIIGSGGGIAGFVMAADCVISSNRMQASLINQIPFTSRGTVDVPRLAWRWLRSTWPARAAVRLWCGGPTWSCA